MILEVVDVFGVEQVKDLLVLQPEIQGKLSILILDQGFFE